MIAFSIRFCVSTSEFLVTKSRVPLARATSNSSSCSFSLHSFDLPKRTSKRADVCREITTPLDLVGSATLAMIRSTEALASFPGRNEEAFLDASITHCIRAGTILSNRNGLADVSWFRESSNSLVSAVAFLNPGPRSFANATGTLRVLQIVPTQVLPISAVRLSAGSNEDGDEDDDDDDDDDDLEMECCSALRISVRSRRTFFLTICESSHKSPSVRLFIISSCPLNSKPGSFSSFSWLLEDGGLPPSACRI
mmetsp:Transcript_4208/g.9869  ORF Transcript_4208/g.9869 Transcript_4208/m.9869 type:complete len:252 (+) Transcript_4208:1503-2258(+)